jgi:cell division septation protein DedD
MLKKVVLSLSVLFFATISVAQTVDQAFQNQLGDLVNIDAVNQLLNDVTANGQDIQGTQFETFLNSINTANQVN